MPKLTGEARIITSDGRMKSKILDRFPAELQKFASKEGDRYFLPADITKRYMESLANGRNT